MDGVAVSGLADELVARMIEQRDLLQAADEHCRSVSARVTSRDESVTVEVDAVGAMTGLWLRPQALRLGPDALAKLIVDSAQAAAKVCFDRQNFLIAEFDRRLRALEKAALTCWDGTTITRPQG